MKEMAESQPFSLFSMRDFWDSLADSFARRDVKHRLLIHRQLETWFTTPTTVEVKGQRREYTWGLHYQHNVYYSGIITRLSIYSSANNLKRRQRIPRNRAARPTIPAESSEEGETTHSRNLKNPCWSMATWQRRIHYQFFDLLIDQEALVVEIG